MLWFLRIIHQAAGVIGALIILMMSITGLLLNHQSLIGYSSAEQIKLQKFIFGLHSGTIGNTSFVWLTDLGAVCMIVLSVTGLWLWINVSIRKKLVLKRRKTS
jgi:hypothetical protein